MTGVAATVNKAKWAWPGGEINNQSKGGPVELRNFENVLLFWFVFDVCSELCVEKHLWDCTGHRWVKLPHKHDGAQCNVRLIDLNHHGNTGACVVARNKSLFGKKKHLTSYSESEPAPGGTSTQCYIWKSGGLSVHSHPAPLNSALFNVCQLPPYLQATTTLTRVKSLDLALPAFLIVSICRLFLQTLSLFSIQLLPWNKQRKEN